MILTKRTHVNQLYIGETSRYLEIEKRNIAVLQLMQFMFSATNNYASADLFLLQIDERSQEHHPH